MSVVIRRGPFYVENPLVEDDSDPEPESEPEVDLNHPHDDQNGGKTQTKKEIGLLHSTAVVVGVMIGSGIFVSPVSIIHHSGSIGLSLSIWVLSGVLVLFVALSYTEIGTMLPFAGAEAE